MHGEVPKREAIYQARVHNPNFFDAVFTDLMDKEKDEETVRRALETIDRYLEDRTFTLFQPLFDFLASAGGTRTATELSDHFRGAAGVGRVCLRMASSKGGY